MRRDVGVSTPWGPIESAAERVLRIERPRIELNGVDISEHVLAVTLPWPFVEHTDDPNPKAVDGVG